MTEHVHFIPVGFDFERLIQPISKGELEADRVILVTHDGEPDDSSGQAAELASNMANQLRRTFDLLDVEVDSKGLKVEELYDYEKIYQLAYDQLLKELGEGNEVYVNISSMPRTAAFAYATAADSIITEFQQDGRLEEVRKRLHTYYVAPEEYLVLRMIELLEDTEETLSNAKSEYEDIRFHGLHDEIQNLLGTIYESGVTRGARVLDEETGRMYVEFPSPPGSDVEGFEKRILEFLDDRGSSESTSTLAKDLAEEMDEEYGNSFRSKVQYNVSNLEEKGYVDREKKGNRLETQLSTMGRMWVKNRGSVRSL
ncbi:DUF6293 family protein [Halobacterium sp. R2-5]|uniref:HFX_2341 family transcriptional regulator domain-containing protein n=1 Tax=Halobacterium sp. R2-5 TaxID=2715751 RepID=UPI00141EB3C3|nr:DUF6293 family protein [Halobacterium sp. R2-5]NIC00921.1 MarR family transcriptional regulator [Halobacterium sp. R2-5]